MTAKKKKVAKKKTVVRKTPVPAPAPPMTMAQRAAVEMEKKGQPLPESASSSPVGDDDFASARPTNEANPDRTTGIALVSKHDMKQNIAAHTRDIKTAHSEEEDEDIRKVLAGEDLPTASEVNEEVYIFRSKEDFISGFFVSGPPKLVEGEDGKMVEVAGKPVKVRARFEGSSFTLTMELCETYGVTMKDYVIGMVKNDRRNLRYMLVSGPGIVRNEKMIRFDKLAQIASSRRDALVTQGPRGSGHKDGHSDGR